MRVLVAAAVALVASGAHAETRVLLVPELTLGAGYDDNLFLDANPSGPNPTQLKADAIIDVHPALAARLVTGDHALALTADYLERITPSNGELRDLLARLDWASPAWHRLRLLAGGFYEHYQATEFADNTFDLGGGDAALRLILRGWYLQAGYRADARAYSDPSRNGEVDVEQRAYALAHARLHRVLGGEVGYNYLHIGSNNPVAALDRHLAELSLWLRPWPILVVSATYGLQAQTVPDGAPQPAGGPRHDLAHRLVVAVSVRATRWLECFARYDLIDSGSDQPTGVYRRDQVLAGVTLTWEFAHTFVEAPTPTPTPSLRQVTFRARAHAGARVAVIGDWNAWTPQPLAPDGGDRYAATLALPPGRHAWSLVVDGIPTTPPDAAAYSDDGFGGKNALVEVP